MKSFHNAINNSGITNINGVRDSFNQSLLYNTVEYNRIDILEYLLNIKEINIEATRYGNGDTPLLYAANFARYEMFKYLCDRGANIEAVNNQGECILHYIVNGPLDDERTELLNYIINVFKQNNVEIKK